MAKFLKNCGIHSVIWLLVLQVAFAPAVFAAGGDGNNNNAPYEQYEAGGLLTAEQESFITTMENASERTPVPAARDPHLITRQVHRIYEPATDFSGKSVDRVVQEYSLSQIETNNPIVGVADFKREIRFVYDSKARELQIVRSVFDKKLERYRITDAHVITDVQVLSNIESDANMVLFSTPEGVRALLMKQVRDNVFKAPVGAPIVLPPAPGVEQITKLEFMTRASAPRATGTERVRGGDLFVTIEGFESKGEPQTQLIDRGEILINLRGQMLNSMILMFLMNPEPEFADAIKKIIAENQVDLEKLEAAKARMIEDARFADLVKHAWRNLGQNTKFENMSALFEKNATGLDQFETLAQAPRDIWSADPSKEGEWMKDHKTIMAGIENDKKAGGDTRSWNEILVDAAKGREGNAAEIKEAAKTEATILNRMTKRIETVFHKIVTPKRLKIAAAVLAGYALNRALDGAPAEWLTSVGSNLLQWSTDVPGLKIVTKPIAGSLNFFENNWATARWVMGMGIICAFYPLSLYAAKLAALKNHRHMSTILAFFSFGARGYARANYPLQKLLIWDRFRQKNLYKVMDQGVSPFAVGAAWNSPFASETTIKENAKKIDTALNNAAHRKELALTIAAATVAAAETMRGNQLDVATLMMAAEKNLAGVVDITRTPTGTARWNELTQVAYQALVKMGDGSLGPIDAKEMVKYHKALKKVAKELILQSRAETEFGARLLLETKRLARRSKMVMSKKVIPYLFFGKQGYDIYRKYKDVQVDKKTAEIAAAGYREDYIASAIMYGAADARKFADIPVMGHGSPEIVANQLSQVFIYGVQGAIDPLSAAEGTGLENPYRPLADALFAEESVREQKVTEALKIIVDKTLDPQSKSFAENHAQYMVNTIEGFQVRFMADYLTRIMGVYLTKRAAGESIALDALVGGSAAQSAFFLLRKISLSPSAIGYAVVWPYIHLAMRFLKDSAEKNHMALDFSRYFLDAGIRFNDAKLYQEGVKLIKGLYEQGNAAVPGFWRKHDIKLPAHLDVEPEKYTGEMAKELMEFTIKNVPVATKSNGKVATFLNAGFGAVLSTVLFADVSGLVYSKGFEAGPALVATIGWFAGSYVTLKALAPTLKALAAKTRPVLKPVADFGLNAIQTTVDVIEAGTGFCKALLTSAKVKVKDKFLIK